MKKLSLLFIFLFSLIIISSCKKEQRPIKPINVTFKGWTEKSWYHDAIFYEIWVKSFADSSDSDQIGDIKGIIEKLDYLQELGITAIKLSPIFDCNYKSLDPHANMHGYDITNFYEINNIFGSKKDVKELLTKAHKRNMKIIFDYVPNHTSHLHPWFINSQKGGNKRNWYVWQKNPSKEWEMPWGGGNWSQVWHKSNGSYYYSAFPFFTIPDLNYRNPQVQKAMENIVKYWLDFGFDGIRVDAARYLVENGPRQAADQPETHKVYKDLRRVLNKFKSKKIMIAESWTSKHFLMQYFGNGQDEFHMCFDFPFANALAFGILNKNPSGVNSLLAAEQKTFPAGYRVATMHSNHDNVNARPYSLYKNNLNQCVLSAATNLLSPGVPFIYYGNEIGLEGARKQGWDDNQLRKNMNWQEVEKQSKDKNSLLSWYKYLNTIRKKYKALRRGNYIPVHSSDKSVLSYIRSFEDESILVILNYADKEKDISLNFKYTKLAKTNFSTIIGTLDTESTLDNNYNDFEINNIPAYGILVLYAGDEKQTLVAGFPTNITGGAKEPKIASVAQKSMYLRGSMNNWLGSSMKKTKDRVWKVTILLTPGDYEYKYEIGGKKEWQMNWGENGNDKLADLGAPNIKLTVTEKGKYEFQFNEVNLSYKVIKI